MVATRSIACIACMLLAWIALTAADTADATPGYSVGFETEQKLLVDFARSAQARAEAIGTDFNHVSVVAKKAQQQELKAQQEHELAVKQFHEARRARLQARLAKEKKKHAAATQSVFDIKADLAAKEAEKAKALAAKTNKLALSAEAKAAASRAALSATTKSAVKAAKKAAAKADALAKTATTPQAKAAAAQAKLVAVQAQQAATKAQKVEAKAAKQAVAVAAKAKQAIVAAKTAMKKAETLAKKATTPAARKAAAAAQKAAVKAERAAAVAVKAQAKLAAKTSKVAKAAAKAAAKPPPPVFDLESAKLKVPEWPSLNDPANAAAHVLIRASGPQTGVFRHQDGSTTNNIKAFPKFSGRESYAEHFKEWPQPAKADPVAAAKIQAKAVAEFRRQKFLGKAVTKPTPKVLAQKVVQAQKAIAAKKQPVVAPKAKTVAPVAPVAPVDPVAPVAPPAVQTVTTPAKSTSKVATKQPEPEKKPFSWWIVALIVGSLLLCLTCAAIFMALRRKPESEAELDVHQG